MLLNIGPTAEGEIPMVSEKILNEVGKWLEINGKSIYGTHQAEFISAQYLTTESANQLFLHIFGQPWTGIVKLHEITAESDYDLSTGRQLLIKREEEGISIDKAALLPCASSK